ncbi:NUDIX domain-containing protein [Candidatus Kaiserbacteria bacterium]|nr:NUDIX domain-containing protein [Candidatus Kaiserbacteria bacterium]
MTDRVVGGQLPLERYRASMEDMPLVTIDVVFLNSDKTKILLGRRTNEPYAGQFYSFGGRLYKNEGFLEAACRIAREEVGISLAPEALTFAGVLNEIGDSSIFAGVNYHAVDVYFVCIIKDESVQLDNQHSETKWFSVNDADLHPNVKARIEGVLKVIN